MNCENNLCIYWSQKKCLLKIISLNSQGNCYDCINIDIDDEYLENKREKYLQYFEEKN